VDGAGPSMEAGGSEERMGGHGGELGDPSQAWGELGHQEAGKCVGDLISTCIEAACRALVVQSPPHRAAGNLCLFMSSLR
jgi:hypothetical protein